MLWTDFPAPPGGTQHTNDGNLTYLTKGEKKTQFGPLIKTEIQHFSHFVFIFVFIVWHVMMYMIVSLCIDYGRIAVWRYQYRGPCFVYGIVRYPVSPAHSLLLELLCHIVLMIRLLSGALGRDPGALQSEWAGGRCPDFPSAVSGCDIPGMWCPGSYSNHTHIPLSGSHELLSCARIAGCSTENLLMGRICEWHIPTSDLLKNIPLR